MSGTLSGITPSLDQVSLDHLVSEIKKADQLGELSKEGWQFLVSRYNIPHVLDMGTGQLHTNLEVYGPERADHSRFYASLDMNSYVGKNTGYVAAGAHALWPYAPGTEARVTTDLERPNNWVVLDKYLQERGVVQTGIGTDVLLSFAVAAEKGKVLNSQRKIGSDTEASGPDYYPGSRGGDPHIMNSNSAPVAMLSGLVDIHKIPLKDNPGQMLDLTVTEKGGYLGGYIGDFDIPGAADDIRNLMAHKEPLFFEELHKRIKANEAAGGAPGGSAVITQDPATFQRLGELMTSLHPDYVAATDPDMGGMKIDMPKFGR